MTDINAIAEELRKPFHPSQVYWKPGSLNDDRTRALALAYADLRAYQNRLDEVCGMDWSVTYTPWGDRIVCHLTVCNVTRSSTGESSSQSERSETGGCSAEAQAFKRACAMFGLGRYLYNLPSLWVEYDQQSRSFTESARARLDMVVNQHYRRVMSDQPETEQQKDDESSALSEADDFHLGQLWRVFDTEGRDLYGEQWEQISRHNAERISNGLVTDPRMLDADQLQKLINGMQSLQRKRQAMKG